MGDTGRQAPKQYIVNWTHAYLCVEVLGCGACIPPVLLTVPDLPPGVQSCLTSGGNGEGSSWQQLRHRIDVQGA